MSGFAEIKSTVFDIARLFIEKLQSLQAGINMYVVNVLPSVKITCLFSDEIRQDIEDAVSRLCPWKAEDRNAFWGGWARMAQPIINFGVVEVAKPNIGTCLLLYYFNSFHF